MRLGAKEEAKIESEGSTQESDEVQEEDPKLSCKERVMIGLKNFPWPVGYYNNGQLMEEPNKEYPYRWTKFSSLGIIFCSIIVCFIKLANSSSNWDIILTNFRPYSNRYTPVNFIKVQIDSGSCDKIKIKLGENQFDNLEDINKKCIYSV